MYLALDAEYFSSSLYFIAGVIVLNFWLINLFVAVVINTFKSIRADTRHSAFGAGPYVMSIMLTDDQRGKASRSPAGGLAGAEEITVAGSAQDGASKDSLCLGRARFG